jgi:hypothetical protein
MAADGWIATGTEPISFPISNTASNQLSRSAYKRGRSDGDVIWNSEGCAAVANAALRHACDAGQIVTRAEFDRAVGDRKARDMAVAEAVRTWAWDRAAGPYEGTRPNYDWAVQYRQAIVFADLAPIIAGVEA